MKKKKLAIGYFCQIHLMWNFMQSNKSCTFSIKSRLKLRTLEKENFVKFGYSYKKNSYQASVL